MLDQLYNSANMEPLLWPHCYRRSVAINSPVVLLSCLFPNGLSCIALLSCSRAIIGLLSVPTATREPDSRYRRSAIAHRRCRLSGYRALVGTESSPIIARARL
eukprot:gene23352-biopygen8573